MIEPCKLLPVQNVTWLVLLSKKTRLDIGLAGEKELDRRGCFRIEAIKVAWLIGTRIKAQAASGSGLRRRLIRRALSFKLSVPPTPTLLTASMSLFNRSLILTERYHQHCGPIIPHRYGSEHERA